MPLTPEKRMLLVVALFLVALSVIKGGYYVRAYGGVDLRSISVASRLLDTGGTAYFHRWSPGESEKYLDPNVPQDTRSNAVTVAPGTLYVVWLFNGLRYPLLRLVWATLQYLVIFSIFCYFYFQRDNSADRRWSIVVVGGLFFLCTPIWFLNTERGQVYFLFAFFFTLIYALYRSPSPAANVLAGVVMAAAAYCRPNFAFLLLPVLLVRQWRVLAGWLGAAVLLAIHAWGHRGLWTAWSAVVHEFSDLGPATSTVVHPGYVYPGVIEGAKNLTKYKTDFVCGGIQPLSTWFRGVFTIGTPYFYLGVLVVVLAVLVLAFKKELAKKEASTILLFGFLLYMVTEYIMPASRSAYNLLLWIFPVLLFLQRPRFPAAVFVLLIAGLCLINGFPFYLPLLPDLGEALLVFCLCYYLKTPEVKTPTVSAPSSY